MKNFDKTEKNDEVLIRLGRKLFDFWENKKNRGLRFSAHRDPSLKYKCFLRTKIFLVVFCTYKVSFWAFRQRIMRFHEGWINVTNSLF
jgi:hypothetical protein